MNKTIDNLLNQNLALYLPFDGKYTDQSVNNHPITVGSGFSFVEDPWGQPNGALRFTNAASDITFPRPFANADQTTQPWTISFWVKTAPMGDRISFLNYRNNSTLFFYLEYETRNKSLWYDQTAYFLYSTTNAITTGTWNHVVLMLDYANSKRAQIYVNGVNKSDYHPTSSIPSNFHTSWILGPQVTHDVDVCEFRVYDRAWTVEEVQMYYANSSHNINRGLIRYYKMQNATDTTDYTGLSSGATFVNRVLSSEGPDGIKDAGVHMGTENALKVYLSIPSVSFTEFQPYSISCWMRYDGTALSIYNIFLSNRTPGFYVTIKYGGCILFRIGNDNYMVPTNQEWADSGKWYHFVYTYDSDKTIRCYVDNKLIGSIVSVGGTSSFNTLGGYIAEAEDYNAIYSEFRVYNRKLSTTEIQELYSQFRLLNDSSIHRIYSEIKDNVRFWCDFDNINNSTLISNDELRIEGTIVAGAGGTNTTVSNMIANCDKNGLNFDGTDYVDLPRILNPNETFTHITVMVWVKPTDVASYRYILSSLDSESPFKGLGLYVRINNFGSYINGNYRNSTEIIEANKTYFVALAYFIHATSGYIKISINGKEYETLYSGDTSNAQPNITNNFKIGKFAANIYFLLGNLYHLSILDRELSESEISKFYRYTRHAFSDTPDTIITSLSNNLVFGEGDVMDSLALYLPMNEGAGTTLYDYSGNGNNGIITGGTTWTTNQNNIENRALNFNGATDYAYVPYNNSISPPEFTISIWFKLNEWTGDKQIFFTHWNGFSVEIGTNKILYMYVTGNSIFPATKVLDNDVWYHFVAIYKAGVGNTAYINGYNYGTVLGTGAAITYSSSILTIGLYDSSLRLRGSMSDLRLYNRALSPSEVTRVYNATKPNLI